MKKQLGQKGFHLYIILLIVLLSGIIGFTGWYVYNAQHKTNQSTNENTTLVATITPTPSITPTPDPTADWQAYENDKFYYSVKYPADWEISPQTSEDETFFIKKNSAVSYDYPVIIRIPTPYLNWAGGINNIYPSNTTFEDFVTKYWLYPDRGESITVSEIINTPSGSAYFISYSGQWFEEHYVRYAGYYKSDNDLVVEFQLDTNPNAEDLSDYRLLVSTFDLAE